MARWRPPRSYEGDEHAAQSFPSSPRLWSLLIGTRADWLVSEPAPAALPVTITSTAPPDPPSSSAGRVIQLENPADAAKPFQTVQIQGTYRGGADTPLRVQRWEGGRWLDFPLPAVTDQAGQFTAYVELGGPGLLMVSASMAHCPRQRGEVDPGVVEIHADEVVVAVEGLAGAA